MKKATFSEYQKAKAEVMKGGDCREYTDTDKYDRVLKIICCEDGNSFYEVTENGVTEFWSTKHSKSQKYEEPQAVAAYKKKGTEEMTGTMKKFMVYMDDGVDCFKTAVPAENEEEVLHFVAGNGEVIAVKDITDECQISSSKVFTALKKAGFCTTELFLITRALEIIDICNPLI